MVAMIGIAPLQYPSNAQLNFAPAVNSLLDYRQASEAAADQRALAHAGTLSPDEGYRYLMSQGMPEQARAMMMFPLQQALQRAQERYLGVHATQAEAQTGLTNEQAEALRTTQHLQRMFVNGLMPGLNSGSVSYTPSYITARPSTSFDTPLNALHPMSGLTPFSFTPMPGFTYTPSR